MRSYPVELRKRIVEAVEKLGMSRRKAAEVFGVGEATVYRCVPLSETEQGG
jgi:transposase